MALPHAPSSPRRPRRRAAFLTRTEIVAAAAQVLEAEGYDALNMRSLAAHLDVRAAALYRHVASRAELDDLLFDHLMADCLPPLEGGRNWRADVVAIARAWRARLLERRDVTRIAMGKVSIGPNIAPLMDASLATLVRAGLSDAEAVEIYQAVLVVVHGFASAEAGWRDLASRPVDGLRIAPLPPVWAQAYPTLARLEPRISATPDFETRFTFALEALISGIERRLPVAKS